MTAGEIKCPECGGGFVDIAPDMRLDDGDHRFGRLKKQDMFGHCGNGHGFFVGWSAGGVDGTGVVRISGVVEGK